MDDMIKYENTGSIIDDACQIVENAQKVAYKLVDTALVIRNWLLGKRISEEGLNGADRAEYGMEVVKNLSASLTSKYGKGFSKRSVYKFLQFYKCFPEIVPTVSAQLLSWSHYERLLQVSDENARNWYAKEAYEKPFAPIF